MAMDIVDTTTPKDLRPVSKTTALVAVRGNADEDLLGDIAILEGMELGR